MGLFVWLQCVRMQRSTKTTATGFCVALDVTQTLLEMDHLITPGLTGAQLTARSRQQTAAFKPEKFTSVFSSGENTSLDDGCSLAV